MSLLITCSNVNLIHQNNVRSAKGITNSAQARLPRLPRLPRKVPRRVCVCVCVCVRKMMCVTQLLCEILVVGSGAGGGRGGGGAGYGIKNENPTHSDWLVVWNMFYVSIYWE